MTDSEKIALLKLALQQLENHIRSKGGDSEMLKQVRDNLEKIQ